MIHVNPWADARDEIHRVARREERSMDAELRAGEALRKSRAVGIDVDEAKVYALNVLRGAA